jgi:hypothetical protein
MSDLDTLFPPGERPDPKAVAAYLADMAGEMEELAEGAGLRGVAALMRAAALEASRIDRAEAGADAGAGRGSS